MLKALPQLGIPVHLLRPCAGTTCPTGAPPELEVCYCEALLAKGDNGFVPHVLALGEWRFEDLQAWDALERDTDVTEKSVSGLQCGVEYSNRTKRGRVRVVYHSSMDAHSTKDVQGIVSDYKEAAAEASDKDSC